jgi:phytoene dehydrogenase-like protein
VRILCTRIIADFRDVASTAGRTFSAVSMMLVENARKAGVDILTGSPAKVVEPDGTLIMENGDRRKADLAIGCDGYHSTSGIRSVWRSRLGSSPMPPLGPGHGHSRETAEF